MFIFQEGSVHKILAKIILEDLDQRGDVDDHFVYIYCKVASVLELDLNIDDEELDELVELCTSVIKVRKFLALQPSINYST